MNFLIKIVRIGIGCLLLSLTLCAQSKNGFEITGNIDGLHEGEKITLELLADNEVLTLTDSANVSNGAFRISGFVPGGGPRLYVMGFGGKGHEFKAIRLLLANEQKITIKSGDIDKIQHGILDAHVIVEGSPTNKAWLSFTPAATIYSQCYYKINNCLKKIKDSIGFDKQVVDGLMMAKESIIRTIYSLFLFKFPDEFKPAILMSVYGNDLFENTDHAGYWINVYNNMDENLKNTYYGKKLKDKLSLCVGQPFPEFYLPSDEGKFLASQDIIARSKLTIIHFWASQSYRRTELQQELKDIYKIYHKAGLNIIGVSSDNDSTAWKTVIKRQNFPWYNVSDGKGDSGIVKSTYHEIGNPSTHNTTNVLIDSNGRIIAWNVEGVELQYYLEKYLNRK